MLGQRAREGGRCNSDWGSAGGNRECVKKEREEGEEGAKLLQHVHQQSVSSTCLLDSLVSTIPLAPQFEMIRNSLSAPMSSGTTLGPQNCLPNASLAHGSWIAGTQAVQGCSRGAA